MSHLKTSNSSILVNEIPGSKIQSKRGLRQGDPLSPLLFNLIADVFTKIIKKAVGNGLLGNVGKEITNNGLSILQFADDTIIFTSHLPKHIIALKFILYSFELISGLNINFDKSAVMVLNDIDKVEGLVANTLNCMTMKFPIDYLGFLIRPTKLLHDDWLIIINKINSRCYGSDFMTQSQG